MTTAFATSLLESSVLAGSVGAVDLASLAGVALLVALGEVWMRRLARKPSFRPRARGQPSLTARSAQHVYEQVNFAVAPALVAGTIALARNGNPALAIFVAVSIWVTSTLLWPGSSPIHLMPLARTILRFVLPAVGLALAMAPGLVEPWELTPEIALPALLGAWIIVGFGMWLEASFAADRPIRLAVIGSRTLARKLALEMRQTRVRGYVVIGYIGPEAETLPDRDPRKVLPWLGELNEVREIVQIIGIDLLAVGPDTPRLHVFEETANACLDLPVRMVEASALYEEVLGHVPIGQINSAWFQCIMHPRYSPTSPLSKRILDVAVAVPVAIASLPLLPLAAIAIKLADGGPVFYRQRRVGEQGREFDILKLRTMQADASEFLDSVPKDELITPIGRILRKTHVDELPQLFNVLKGEMTIVGPRPEQPQLVEQLSRVVPYYERRSLVRPGVTGWAQVRCGYAGSQVGTAWKICHDLNYVKRRSIVFDLLIILQTLQLLAVSKAEDVEIDAPAEDFILGEAASLVSR